MKLYICEIIFGSYDRTYLYVVRATAWRRRFIKKNLRVSHVYCSSVAALQTKGTVRKMFMKHLLQVGALLIINIPITKKMRFKAKKMEGKKNLPKNSIMPKSSLQYTV